MDDAIGIILFCALSFYLFFSHNCVKQYVNTKVNSIENNAKQILATNTVEGKDIKRGDALTHPPLLDILLSYSPDTLYVNAR